MLKIGLPANISEDFLLDFPKENVELVRLPDTLDHPVEVEFGFRRCLDGWPRPCFRTCAG